MSKQATVLSSPSMVTPHPGIRLQHGPTGQIDVVYFLDGTYGVDHRLIPPKPETSILLRVAGVEEWDVSEAMLLSRGTTRYHIGRANEMLLLGEQRNSYEHRTRLNMAVGRLCMSEGVLVQTKLISIEAEPEKTYIEIMEQLGAGYSWNQAAEQVGFKGYKARQDTIDYAMEQYRAMNPQADNVAVQTMLLHAYGAGLLDPDVIVEAQQERLAQVKGLNSQPVAS